METGEDELLHRALGGDADALGALLQHHAPAVRRQLAGAIPRRWRPLMSIDDVLQQAFAEVFVGIGRFRDRGGQSFLGWLVTLARCTLIDGLRMLEADKRGGGRRQVFGVGEESSVALYEMLGGNTSTPSRHAARGEATGAVRRAMESLPEAQRRLVELYDLQGMPVEAVAATLGRSVGAVYMMRARAHRALCQVLGTSADYLTRRE